MRIGAIDCGTNSIRLLIAEVEQTENGPQLVDLERIMKIVRLGEGVDATGKFAEAALQRTFTAAREYAEILARYDVQSLRFGATSATRDAQNRQIFIEGIEEILGVRPEVIAGEEEAALSFAGAASAVNNSDQRTVVVDLGGGSTEFVLGNQQGIVAARSLNIGCVRLTERYAAFSPLTAEQREQILLDVDRAIDEAAETIDFYSAERLIGVAGTVTTVTAHALNLDTYDSQAINATYLPVKEIEKAARSLYSMDREQRAALGFMHEGRIDVIGTGALIWARIVERLSQLSGGKIDGAIASEFDILDGLVLSQIDSTR